MWPPCDVTTIAMLSFCSASLTGMAAEMKILKKEIKNEQESVLGNVTESLVSDAHICDSSKPEATNMPMTGRFCIILI